MSTWKKLLIGLFLGINFLSMARTFMPLDNQFISSIYRPVDHYLSFFSIYQSWNMFSPNPARVDSHITAEVEFDDGSSDIYYFPDSKNLSLKEKYAFGERYRVLLETARQDSNSFLWKDLAKFALRKLRTTNYDKIPLKVHLYRHWSEIPSMETKFIPRTTRIETDKSHKFFTHEVL